MIVTVLAQKKKTYTYEECERLPEGAPCLIKEILSPATAYHDLRKMSMRIVVFRNSGLLIPYRRPLRYVNRQGKSELIGQRKKRMRPLGLFSRD